jgi:hypothetical protein
MYVVVTVLVENDLVEHPRGWGDKDGEIIVYNSLDTTPVVRASVVS